MSRRKYKDELSLMFNENQINIIGLNETRLNQTVKDQEIHIDGYQIFRNDRNLISGGVAFYVTDVKVKLKSDELGLLCLEITPCNAKGMFLLSWYRPPTPDTDKTSFD